MRNSTWYWLPRPRAAARTPAGWSKLEARKAEAGGDGASGERVLARPVVVLESEQVQERGLAGSRGTDDGHVLALADDEVHAVERLHGLGRVDDRRGDLQRRLRGDPPAADRPSILNICVLGCRDKTILVTRCHISIGFGKTHRSPPPCGD